MSKKSMFKLKGTEDDYSIPDAGSLALMALGYRGLIAWRKAKGSLDKHQKMRVKRIINSDEEE